MKKKLSQKEKTRRLRQAGLLTYSTMPDGTVVEFRPLKKTRGALVPIYGRGELCR